MRAARHLAVIAYDVSDDRDRARLASLLERRMNRVQESVFEGWLTRTTAQTLFERAARLGGPDGSVRMYLLPRSAVLLCRAHGFPPVPEADDFLLV